MNQRIKRVFIILILIISQVALDQITKEIVREKLEYHEDISIYKDNLILTKVENQGAFLSLGANLPPQTRTILLSILPALVVFGAIGFLFTQKNMTRVMTIGLSCVIAGGIGNLIDRILYGSVTDFMFINLGGIFRTGIFNIADMSIMTGIFLTMIPMVLTKKQDQETV